MIETMKKRRVSHQEFEILYQENRDYLFEKYGRLPVMFDTVWIDRETGERVLFHKGEIIIRSTQWREALKLSHTGFLNR